MSYQAILSHLTLYRALLEEYNRQLGVIDNDLRSTQVDTFRANRELDRLELEAQDLQEDLENFKDQSIDIESSNVEGG